jgi:glyoxylase-like metal-dependent hydrolase (beta-lactamase superfamily II)
VGWASDADRRPVFPRAVHLCHVDDWSHFHGSTEPCAPLLEGIADRMELWSSDTRVLPGIDTWAAPGHTPGSTILVLSSGAERAMLIGDVVHCPLQLIEQEWEVMLDVDPARAKQTRMAVVRELERMGVAVGGAHFEGRVGAWSSSPDAVR